MTRGLVAVLVASLMCVGCATERPPPAPTQTYTLTGVNPEATSSASKPRSGGVIRIEPVTAPAWMQGRRICYRLDYYNRGEMAYYSQSQWSGHVPAMIGQVVRDALIQYGQWRAVVGPQDDTHATAKVEIRLLDLCQEFSTPKRSTGVLAARVTVSDPSTARVIAQRELIYRKSAPSLDAAGGVAAERQAVKELARDVASWVARLTS
ncbi:MAG: ABC-type transport auxiliary lipoprotein family protein [Chromatiaceae bacterium]|jgi:cholesterol transport system auxiliary component